MRRGEGQEVVAGRRDDRSIQPVSQLPAWASRLTNEFLAQDARAVSLARGLTPSQLNWPPRPGSWSIGQCLEHLHVSNEQYLPHMERALATGRQAPVEEIVPGWFGRWFLETFIDPVSRSRAPAPPKIRPAALVAPDVLARFLAGNQRARELVRRAAPLDVNRVRFRNPFVSFVRFTVGTGFEILSRHQRRHLLQAERVKAAPGFPAP